MTKPDEVVAGAEGTGAKDTSTPVAGAKLVASVDFMAIYEKLPDNKRAKFADQLLKTEPARIAAAKQARRERIRATLTVLLFVMIVGEALVALYIAQVAKAESWDTIKDWLTLALAPLIAAATVAAAFWFPSKETG